MYVCMYVCMFIYLKNLKYTIGIYVQHVSIDENCIFYLMYVCSNGVNSVTYLQVAMAICSPVMLWSRISC